MNDKSDNKQQARRHQRALNLIKRWRLMDDDFMKRCLKDNIPAVECILRIIMEQPDLEVQTLHVEDTIPNLQGHGVRLDVHATDAMGIEYDIEIQRSDQNGEIISKMPVAMMRYSETPFRSCSRGTR